jgi:hypothetical protein
MQTATNHEPPAEMPPKLEEGSETKRLQIVAPASWVDRVDEWRAKHRPIPTKSEAIRVLVDLALEGEAKRRKPR